MGGQARSLTTIGMHLNRIFRSKKNINITAYIYEYKPIVFQKLENQNMKIQKLFLT